MDEATLTLSHTNPYATDGRCHNSEPGTYGHECGKPATWLGITHDGFASGFCDHCRQHGHEAKAVSEWKKPIAPAMGATAMHQFWSIIGRAKTRQQLGPFDSRGQAIEAARSALIASWTKGAKRKPDIMTGYGSDGPWSDLRWHRVEA